LPERYITPSKITAWLDCAHYLALKHAVEDGRRAAVGGGMGSFAQLLADKGLQHELDCLEAYRGAGKSVFDVPQRVNRESFAAWAARIGDPFAGGQDVLYQVPMLHDGIRGIADFLIRVVDENGQVSYEPVDAKLARKEAKPGHVLQLCFYADAIEAATGTRPSNMHLWLGSGRIETLVVEDFAAYWRRLRGQLRALLEAPEVDEGTRPEPCNHCAFCEFAPTCEEQWREEDRLHYVAGLRTADREVLEGEGVTTLAALASVDPIDGLAKERFERVKGQAVLQLKARVEELSSPPYELIAAGDDPVWGRGLEQLPAPDDGDVFLDFEGHPFWRADRGLFFLMGLIERDVKGKWNYVEWWAHDPAEERQATADVIDYLTERRLQFPGMHVYHYNHTERSSLQRLAEDYGVRELELAHLVDTGAFVDLFLVARNAVQVGTESYGLKHLETLTDFERGHDIDQGAGAVVEYEAFMADGDETSLKRIAAYNEDDVRATRALRDWLIGEREPDLPWRDAELLPDPQLPELDEQVAALHAFGPDTVEHLLGDVLGYWRREWTAFITPIRVRCEADPLNLLEDPDAVAGLTPVGAYERLGKTGKPLKNPGMRFTFPEQDLTEAAAGDQVAFVTPEGPTGYASIEAIDADAGTLDLVWRDEYVEEGLAPTVVIAYKWFNPAPKPAAVSELASQVLDPQGVPNPVSMALLRRDLPMFKAGYGPERFTDDLAEMLAWAPGLDSSFVAIQGPPGTGKTYRGAQLVRALVMEGKRVGITAMSHHAIDNLLEAVVDVFDTEGDASWLQAVKKSKSGTADGVTYLDSNPRVASGPYNVVAGTPWLFAGNDMQAAPVDVLLIDEAGQLALADALAAARSARNLILLGDPCQLPQVAQASHPGGGGLSVLEHVLGEDATIPSESGVFLSETWRMHPDVCSFISDEIYEGRLTSHPSCAVQATAFGTGLRWIQAHHSDRVTESEEEAELVHAEILRLLGTSWTDQHGVSAPLTVNDLLVVAPYNDQVHLLRSWLDADERTRGIAVGTVDKFQGRQAAVVFFTMATSTAADMVRSADFLFSRNRFNVAVSRARCLAYLVCTEELLNSRGRDVDEMRLISTLCAFAERAV